MSQNYEDQFLGYYNRELDYLRNSGAIFAKNHPKIARRLELTGGESPDPHLERLLESFAFLSARLSKEIDDRHPQTAAALLSVLYPHLIAPIPAMAIAQFQADPNKGTLTSGFEIPKSTSLFANAQENVTCRFQTVYPITLWPIEVKTADLIPSDTYNFNTASGENPWYLRLVLHSKEKFIDLKINELTFHIKADRALSFLIYESLFSSLNPKLFCVNDGKNAAHLPESTITPIGFSESELTMPSPKHTTPAYQLLQEYFHFPEKFLFFKIDHLDAIQKRIDEEQKEITLLIPLKDVEDFIHKKIGPENFLLGCSPIVNLFPKTTDPFRLDHRKSEYRLIPDQRRDRTTEIHTILDVISATDGKNTPDVVSPYFSFNHKSIVDEDSMYWLSRRTSAEARDVQGTDMFLSFVDLKFNPALPPNQIIYAQTLCTNRFLPEPIPEGTHLQTEDSIPITQIICLDKPVPQVYSPTEGETLWRLISQLSINHLSLTAGESSVTALKETLNLYAGPGSSHRHHEIESIHSLTIKPIVRRIGNQAWRGFVNGLELTLTLKDRSQSGGSPFLLAAVLRHYFALQVSINSFIELKLQSTEEKGDWMKWKPLSGEQTLL